MLCSIAESEEHIASMKNSFGRAERINVGLNSMVRIGGIVRHFCKAFQHQVVDTRLIQRVSYFSIRGFDRLESLRIVGEIPFHP